MKRIVFRCDASFAIGSGHVMRSLTLAAQLRERGAHIGFVCRSHDGDLTELIAAQGYALASLPAPDAAWAATPGTAGWLGAPWHDDAQQTLAALRQLGRPDWLVVDHYAIDARWESALRPAAGGIMAIDDLADRAHDCDVLLDQNLLTGFERRYDGKVPSHCKLLLGPGHALLQPLYAPLHAQLRAQGARAGAPAPVKHLLVYFGGADNDDLTGRALDAILAAAPQGGLDVDIVVSAKGRHTPALRERIAGRAGFRLHSALPSLAPLMLQADLAIGAGGATTWERLCLGLPSLVITLADNQVAVARELAERKLIHWLGQSDEVTVQHISAALRPCLEHGAGAIWRGDSADLVDGQGCARVATAILAPASSHHPGGPA